MASDRRRDRDDEFDDDRPSRRRSQEDYDPREDYADAPYGAGAHRGPVGKGVNVCGVIALILGIVGLIFSLIPCIGIIGIPLAVIGLVLGIIGMLTGGKTTGRGLAIAGTCVSVAALLIGGAWLLIFAYAGRQGQQQAIVIQQQAEADMKAAEERARADEQQLRQGPAVTATAEKLYEDFEANALSAEKQYKDKVVEITGPVLRTDKDALNRLVVHLDAGKDGLILCEFPRSAQAELEKLKPLQKVTIRGRCVGRERKKDMIKVENCTIVSRK